MKSKLRDLKRQLLEVTQENTELVEGIAGSTSKQMRLEKELDQPRGDMYDLSGGADTAMQEAEERAKLIQVCLCLLVSPQFWLLMTLFPLLSLSRFKLKKWKH